MQNRSNNMQEHIDSHQEQFRKHSAEHQRFRENRPIDDANFQFWLHNFFGDLRDLRLPFWGNLATSIGLEGSEAQVPDSSKKKKNSGQ